MRFLYSYSHPDSPQESLGLLAVDPSSMYEAEGEFVDIKRGDSIIPRKLEVEHFTLISEDPTLAREFESTPVYSGFNPFHNFS